jgi:ubiquinone/menaquinone biosynthesis C-methylase UbiE
MDSFLAVRQVGETGRVIGVDMTDAQLTKARRLAAQHGFANVDFVDAHIEQLSLADASTDVVISNGVSNLSPDKPAVFAEAARVLRHGGRLALATSSRPRSFPSASCATPHSGLPAIGGAMQRDDYRDAIETAGFTLDDLKENHEYRFVSERAENATRKYGVRSISLVAVKR